jgi:hypothetical protein
MNRDLVTVKTFSQIPDAGLVQSYLESEGIRTFLENDIITGLYGGASIFGGIKLQVMEEDLELALHKLEEGGFADES